MLHFSDKGVFGQKMGYLTLESYMFAHKKPRDILWTFYKRKRKLIFPVYILAKNSFLKLSFSLLSISRFVRYIRCKKNATLFSVATQNFCQRFSKFLSKSFGKYFPIIPTEKGAVILSLSLSCLPVPMFFDYQVLSCFWYLVWNILYQLFNRAV